MAMPKATVNENDRAISRQDDIRSTGEVFTMKPEAVTQSVKNASNGELRPSVFATYRRHIAASLLASMDVNHEKAPLWIKIRPGREESCIPRSLAPCFPPTPPASGTHPPMKFRPHPPCRFVKL
jgi:hypothetical protein